MAVYSGPEISNSGLVLHLDAANPRSYPGSGNTWYDLSGNGNNGTFLNGPNFNNSNNGSIVFDGINDKIITTDIIALTQFTYEIIFKRTSNGYLLYKNNFMNYSDNADNGNLYLTSGRVGFHIEFQTSDNDYTLLSTTVTDTSNYYMVHATFDPFKIQKLYINGIEEASANRSSETNTIYNGTKFYSIGVQGYSNHSGQQIDRNFYNGSISIIKIYNRALTAQEIRKNFEAHRDRYGI